MTTNPSEQSKSQPRFQPPGIGRIVHFVLADGQHRRADVVNAWGGDVVNLTVSLDMANDLEGTGLIKAELLPPNARFHAPGFLSVSSSIHDATGKNPGSFHYPERD